MVISSLGVKGFLPLSMLDWDGHLVTTLFMGSCNLRCPFCHNASLVTDYNNLPDITEDQIREMLTAKQGWVDGVCITGGEPTINKYFFDLISLLKDIGCKIKLDTNGTRPDVIKQIVDEGLVDAVAMDIKTGFKKYKSATGTERDYSEDVKQSASILTDANNAKPIEVEFRTTVVPTFVERDDVIEIAKFIGSMVDKTSPDNSTNDRKRCRYYLQQFNPKSVMNTAVGSIKPYSREELEEMVEEASRYVAASIRGV